MIRNDAKIRLYTFIGITLKHMHPVHSTHNNRQTCVATNVVFTSDNANFFHRHLESTGHQGRGTRARERASSRHKHTRLCLVPMQQKNTPLSMLFAELAKREESRLASSRLGVIDKINILPHAKCKLTLACKHCTKRFFTATF